MSACIDANASGMVNLFSLVNIGKTLAVVQLPDQFSANLPRFNISSVTINVNGKVHSISIGNNILTVPLAG